jgi:hypothetical protein
VDEVTRNIQGDIIWRMLFVVVVVVVVVGMREL